MHPLLAHTVIAAPGATPTRTAFLLHGILGAGRNWRTFARRLAGRRPDWRVVLVDLRHHGLSPALPAPDTLAACADDVAALAAKLGTPSALLGHSFGGKVALMYASRHGRDLQAVGVLDSLPAEPDPDLTAARSSEVARVLAALAEVPVPAADRKTVRAALSAQGLSDGLVMWLLTSLRSGASGWTWVWDLQAIHRLLVDYWQSDLWGVVEGPRSQSGFDGELTFVRAGKSDRWTPEVLERFARLPASRATLVTLPDAGHWLHVDDPEGTLRVVSGLLS